MIIPPPQQWILLISADRLLGSIALSKASHTAVLKATLMKSSEVASTFSVSTRIPVPYPPW